MPGLVSKIEKKTPSGERLIPFQRGRRAPEIERSKPFVFWTMTVFDNPSFTIYGYHMPALVKTTVYLTEREYSRLKELASEQNRPTAELVREAVADYARRHGKHRVPSSLGAGASGRGDLSERAEELLDGMGR